MDLDYLKEAILPKRANGKEMEPLEISQKYIQQLKMQFQK
jgi:hypothetical protein